MGRVKIGVTPLYDSARESIWMLPGYLGGIERAGGIPVILPLTGDPETVGQLCRELDGFLLTGGQDVDPALYGQERLNVCGECCGARDALERTLISLALEQDKPMLGICRGFQILNCMLGGTLWQDLPSQRQGAVAHKQEKPYDAGAHEVRVLPGTKLADCIGGGRHWVNTLHHQGVRKTAPGLVESACAPDGLVEAVELPGKRLVLGVQWHPEYLYERDEDSRRLFSLLVERSAGR